MSTTHDPGSPDTGERAAYWARRTSEGPGSLSDAEHAEFLNWLFASEKNERDYHRSVVLLQMFTELPTSGQNALISASGEGSSEDARVAGRRNILKFAGLAASVAVGIVAGGLYLESRGIFGVSHATRTGEMRTVQFNEGSVAYLNTRTELRWLGTDEDRRVELIAGEALFDVVHDEKRPFSVLLDSSEIRVLGTRFNVYRKDSGDVVVTVLEGTVEVRGFGRGANRPEWVRRVKANQQIEYRSIGLVGEPRETNPLTAVKWRSGLLQIPEEGVLLPVVLDELTRYTDSRILIRDPRLAEVRVGGTFSTRDVRGALQNLRTVAPIEVYESAGLYTLDYRASATERN
jgi:transmembrane sensor